jgi:hypothetical protein
MKDEILLDGRTKLAQEEISRITYVTQLTHFLNGGYMEYHEYLTQREIIAGKKSNKNQQK